MSGLQHVYIHNGKLVVGKLNYQLFDASGEAASFNYFGYVGIGDGKLRIVTGRDGVYDFMIADEPTPESVEYARGYEKALGQRRKRWPNSEKFSRHYISGWLNGWMEKGR